MENKIKNPSKFQKSKIKSKIDYKDKKRKSVIPSNFNFKDNNLNIIKEEIKEKKEEEDENDKLDNIKSNKKSLENNRRKSLINSEIYRKLLSNNKSLTDVTINKDLVLTILNKNPKNRKENEIKIVADYLSENYEYFKNIKKIDSQLKVEKLAKVARINIFYPGETIIRFGDIGDKFYIIIEGFVEIYKPKFESVKMSPNDFIKYMKNIKQKENDENKYIRIKEYNKSKDFDINEYEKKDPSIKIMKTNRDIYIENLELMGKYSEGFSFGEISLITQSTRNATIKCSEDNNNKKTILLSIGKESYNKAIKEFQDKKLIKDIENFIKDYPFCKDLTKENMISLFNCLTKKNLEKGDYLFKQNDEDFNLYFIINGKFEVFSQISLGWINQFMEYIINIKDNTLGYFYVKRPKKSTEIIDIINKIKRKKMKSPMIFKEIDKWEKIDYKVNENNLIGLKFNEEKINDDKNMFKIKIHNIDKPELLGIENSFEFKNKFYTVRCISDKAEIKYIKILDFLEIISNMRLRELNYLIDIVLEKKNIFAKQIMSSIKTLEYQIISNLEMKYEQFLENNNKKIKEIEKNEEEEYNNNKLCSVIKMKGYKSGISDILDEDTDVLDKKPSEIIKSYLYKKKEPSKGAIKLSKKRELIDFIFSNKTKRIKREKDIYKNNNENLLLLKKLIENKSNSMTNIKKLNSTQLNISNFILNNNIDNISNQKSISNYNGSKNDNSIYSSTINEQKFTNSFLINSNYLYKKQKYLNLNNKKENKPSIYLTYKKMNLNNNQNILNLEKRIDDKYKSKKIRSALINTNFKNNFNKSTKIFSSKKPKFNDFDKDKLHKNKSLLNISDIKSNKIKKDDDEKIKMSKTLNHDYDKNNIFGGVVKNKKEFYLGVEFAHKIININKQKGEKLLSHHFPLIKNK